MSDTDIFDVCKAPPSLPEETGNGAQCIVHRSWEFEMQKCFLDVITHFSYPIRSDEAFWHEILCKLSRGRGEPEEPIRKARVKVPRHMRGEPTSKLKGNARLVPMQQN